MIICFVKDKGIGKAAFLYSSLFEWGIFNTTCATGASVVKAILLVDTWILKWLIFFEFWA